MRKYISEFIGTFLLVFMGCGAVVSSNALFSAQGFLPASFGMVVVAAAFGVILAALTYAFERVSGAHLNPAVSFAMLIRKELSAKDFAGYIIGQFAGGIAGAGLLTVLLGGNTSLGANGYGTLSTFGITLWLALLVEVVATFFFVYIVLSVKDRERETGGALMSGIALAAVYLFSVPFTGGSANPARSFGPALLQGGDALMQVWVFIVAPFVGALLAALLYGLLNGKDETKEAAHDEETEGSEEAATDDEEKDGGEEAEEGEEIFSDSEESVEEKEEQNDSSERKES